jgi:2,3-bisphosphoglycerate-dependent phosphoglycerate mutase
MTELLLIRHGETDWNRELRFQGQVDVPLNAVGHEQARRVAQRLAGVSAHHLYVSDLIRTRQTAEPVLQALPLDHAADATLREQNFGLVDGMRVEDIKAQHPEAWASWIQFQEDFAFGGGESTRQFHTRVMDTVQRLAAAHAGQTLLVVTHGGVLDMIYRAALALPLSGPRQCEIPNAGLNHVQVAGDGLKIVSWADTRHLADLPPQPTYDQARLAALAKLSVSPSAA